MSSNPQAARQHPTLPWHRFWVPLGGPIHCEDSGFLSDPEDEFGRYANPNISRLIDLLPTYGPVVLCGEPGIGKSTELGVVRHSLEAEGSTEDKAFWLVFRGISDLADFRRLTVESAVWHAWRADSSRLTLVIDGVDEGLLRVPNFLNDLTALLKNEPFQRMRLVLACRTAEWPIETGRRLIALWSTNNTEPLYELCPLRRKDAADAAQGVNCDPEVFLRTVWERSVVALATRPVTLFFLLGEFRRHGGLPASHRELYERGTANLAREIDPARLELIRSLRKTGATVTDDDRLRSAQRLAALLLLCGRSAIRVSRHAFASELGHDLQLETAAGEWPSPIRMHAIEEAIESALFTSLGEHRFGFVHQTFAECLAAQHLQAVPTIQLRRLLCQRDVREEHVVPQLAELAAWLGGIHPEFCEHLLRIDPEVLLRSDVTRLQGNLKRRLVAAILDGAKKERIFDRRGFGRFFEGLRHPGLGDQLRAVIADPAAGLIARRIAFDIASHCRLSKLTDDLLTVVRDAAEEQHLRDRAAYALEHIVPDERLDVLEPLARGEVGDDKDDAIRGCALRRLVPARWKIRDALPYLTSPRNDSLIGAYHVFLEFEAPKFLEDPDVLPVLRWLTAHAGYFDSLHPASKLALRTVARAVELIDQGPIAEALVKLWHRLGARHMTRSVSHADEVALAFASRPEARRTFVSAFLRHPQLELHDIFHLERTRFLSDASDLCWLLDELPTIAPEHRSAWVQAIARLARDPEILVNCWDKFLQRIHEIEELGVEFAWLREWEIDAPDSRKEKAKWLQHKRRERHVARDQSRWARPDLRRNIAAALEAARAGKEDAWLHLWYYLSRDGERETQRPWSANAFEYPGWADLTYGQRQTCRHAARAYLFHKAEEARRYTPNCYGAFAGAAALWLCFDDVQHDSALKSVLAGPWIDVLTHQFSSDDEPRQRIFALLYRLNPEAATRAMLGDATQQSIAHRHLFAFHNARYCWDAPLSKAVEGFLDSLNDPKSIISGIEEWIPFDKQAAAEYALKFLRSCTPTGQLYSIALFDALVIALQVAPLQSLPIAKSILDADSTLARSVWLSICYRLDMGRGEILDQLDEPSLAEIYLKLSELFPQEEDPPEPGGTVTPRMTARRIRDTLPGIIAARATEIGCSELLRLSSCLPKQATWLRWTYRDAVTNIRRNLWHPPEPEVVKLMLERPAARMLACDDDLMELVVESLGRLQTHLTTQALPAADDLWLWEGAGLRRKNFRPKDEDAVSDYIARWLSKDIGPSAGIVVNREVQPRRGARTDVIVEATTSGSNAGFEKLTVVLEVKGCWHDAVRTGVTTQLVDGYLRVHGWRCGIYLVGWFVCPQWQGAINNLLSDNAQAAADELRELTAEHDGVNSEFFVAPYLLDCTLPPIRPPSS